MELSWVKEGPDTKEVRDSEKVVKPEIPVGWKNYSQNTKGGDPEIQEMLVGGGYTTESGNDMVYEGLILGVGDCRR